MATKTISIALTADASSYRRELNRSAQDTQRFFQQLSRGAQGGGFTRAGQEVRGLGKAHDEVAPKIRRTGQESKKVADEVARSSTRMREGMNSVLQTATGFTVGMMAVSGIRSAFSFAGEAIFGFNSKLQNASIGFETLLGSGTRAQALLTDLKHFAVTTPFEFPDLLDASKRMLALGFSAEQIIPNLRAIGDAAAGLDSGAVGINRITLALGQMQARGKVTADNMRQLTEAGIQAWDILADAQGVSVREIMRQSENGFLSATEAVPQLIEGMQQRFGGMMDKMSHTWTGALSNIKDASLQFIAAGMRPFFNAIAGGMDSLAQHLISPEFQEWITRIGDAGARAMPILLNALRAAMPVFATLGRNARNLAMIFAHLVEDAAPVAGAIAKIGGGAALAGLTMLGKALETVTGFLADNREVTLTLAAIYAATLVPAIWAAIAGFATMVGSQIVTFLLTVAATAQNTALAFLAMGTTMQVAMGVAGAAALAMGGWMIWANKQTHAGTAAMIERAKAAKGSFAQEAEEINRLVIEYNKMQESYNDSQWTASRFGAEQNRNKNDMEKLAPVIEQLTAQHEEHRKKLLADAEAIGLSGSKIESFADKSAQFSDEYVKAMTKASTVTGLTGDQIFNMFETNTEAVNQFGEAVDKAMTATASGFFADSDVIAGAGQMISQANEEATQSSDAHKKATDRLTDAQKKLSQLEARQAFDKKRSVADEQALANARDQVTEATQGVNEAQVKTANSASLITQFYTQATQKTKTFSANINEAIQRGLDPQLVSRLLQAGPEEATPILQGILSDHSGKMIQIVNESEQALAAINTQAVLQARLTQMAVSAPTELLAKTLPIAMQISQREFASGGKESAEALAENIKLTPQQANQIADALVLPPDQKQALVDSLKLSPEQIRQIADSFRIEVPMPIVTGGFIPGLPAGAEAHSAPASGVDVTKWGEWRPGTSTPSTSWSNLRMNARGNVYESHNAVIAKGGAARVWNEPETGGESYIPHAPSKRARSAAILHRTAQILGVRHYADGGIDMPRTAVSSGYRPASYGSSSRTSYTFTGPIQGVKMEDVERYARRKKRLKSLGGADV